MMALGFQRWAPEGTAKALLFLVTFFTGQGPAFGSDMDPEAEFGVITKGPKNQIENIRYLIMFWLPTRSPKWSDLGTLFFSFCGVVEQGMSACEKL